MPGDGQPRWLRLELAFQDLRHATWALWQLGAAGEAMQPDELRIALRDRAAQLAARYTTADQPLTPP